MKMKISRKAKPFLIAGTIVIACAALLVGAIFISEKSEEGKIVKTAYARENETKVEKAIMQDEESEVVKQDSDSNAESKIEDISINVSKEEAKIEFINVVKELFSIDIDEDIITATLIKKEKDLNRIDIWSIRATSLDDNIDFSGSVDGISGEVRMVLDFSEYTGSDEYTKDEILKYEESIREDASYFVDATSIIVEEHLAEGREIVQITYAGSHLHFDTKTDTAQTVIVGCDVIMDGGNNYMIRLRGSEQQMHQFLSYPSQFDSFDEYYYGDDPVVESAESAYTEEVNTQPGPESLTEQQAKEIMVKYTRILHAIELKASNLTVKFSRGGRSVMHDVWSVKSEEFVCSIDAITGDVLMLDYIGEYSGADDGGWQKYLEFVENDKTLYFEKLKKIIEDGFANGHKIEYMYSDAIQTVYDKDNNPTTFLADFYVLMETGRSYSVSFMGTEMIPKWFNSFPSQNACFFGYKWEEEALEYPENWRDVVSDKIIEELFIKVLD